MIIELFILWLANKRLQYVGTVYIYHRLLLQFEQKLEPLLNQT